MRTVFFFLILVCASRLMAQSPQPDRKIWFTHPALDWNEALPVGNGALGAMIFGNVEKERLQLNEKTIWSGNAADFSNPEAQKSLPQIRKLLFEGRYKEAEDLAQLKMMGDKKNGSAYQMLGDLYLDFGPKQQISNYRRELDLSTAIAKVHYTSDHVTYDREIFSSHPHQAIVCRLTASKQNSISFRLFFTRPGPPLDIQSDGNEMNILHTVKPSGVTFSSCIRIFADGGTVSADKSGLSVTSANQVTIVITAATNYDGGDAATMTAKQMSFASEKSFETIRADHIRDYQSFFNRCDFQLHNATPDVYPTDARLLAVQQGHDDPGLQELYFQFGRYLLISSSRDGRLPANLQGIWADGLNPPWDADYHININIQMNYWPAELTNLSELHTPFLNYVEDLQHDGRKTATDMYGMHGSVAHFTSDAWHFTETYGKPQWAMWPMGLAWSVRHFWEHYLFTGDLSFLRAHGYPAMKDAARFCSDWLVLDPSTKKLVSGPSISPENTFRSARGEVATMVMGPTMDHMIIRDLFRNVIAASAVLKIDSKFAATLQKQLEQLAPTRISPDGRIMEWNEPFEEPEPGHRHISQLYGLHPANQITHQQDSTLLDAARKTINHRLIHGGGHTGWSKAWIINFYARLSDGDQAHQHLVSLLQKSTLPNLFDNHPPFQIDGNFGAAAGIVEMLLQSHAGEIELLPALPKAWPSGQLSGVCARGGFELNVYWEDGNFHHAEILSKLGNECVIRYGKRTIHFKTSAGEKYSIDAALIATLLK